MSAAWARLGLRGRLALAIAAIVVVAFGAAYVAVRAQMANESGVIEREEGSEAHDLGRGDDSSSSPIADAQSDVEKTFLLAGGASLVAALLAGYLVAARAASPLRRFAATASAVDAGDLTPRLETSPAAAIELRTLAEAFNHMLDRLDRAFGRQRQFVSDASHELRSPLTAVRGQLEVLARQEHPSAAEIRRVEAVALRELDRVERLVEDLLTLAKLDEGVAPRRRRLRLAPFLSELAESQPGGGAELGELADGEIEADSDLLAQVVRNLLANARRHAGSGGRVVLSAAAGDGGELTVAVDDDGPGIPPARRERVFDRFNRSEAGRERASGGSGLGLGIARSIVELHGGRIRAEDSALGGARVAFTLPGFAPRVRNL